VALPPTTDHNSALTLTMGDPCARIFPMPEPTFGGIHPDKESNGCECAILMCRRCKQQYDIDGGIRALVDPADLVGFSEAADLLKVAYHTVTSWQARSLRNGFPEPVVHLRNGPLFSRKAIRAWRKQYQPRRGRKVAVRETKE